MRCKKYVFAFLFLLVLLKVTHAAFTAYVADDRVEKDDAVACLENYIPVDSPAVVIWYNRIACRACMDEMNNYYKNHSNKIKSKIIVAVYDHGFSSLQKREVKNCLRNDLLPDVSYELVFVGQCPAIMDFLNGYTPSVSVISESGEITSYSYSAIFTNRTVKMSSVFQ